MKDKLIKISTLSLTIILCFVVAFCTSAFLPKADTAKDNSSLNIESVADELASTDGSVNNKIEDGSLTSSQKAIRNAKDLKDFLALDNTSMIKEGVLVANNITVNASDLAGATTLKAGFTLNGNGNTILIQSLDATPVRDQSVEFTSTAAYGGLVDVNNGYITNLTVKYDSATNKDISLTANKDESNNSVGFMTFGTIAGVNTGNIVNVRTELPTNITANISSEAGILSYVGMIAGTNTGNISRVTSVVNGSFLTNGNNTITSMGAGLTISGSQEATMYAVTFDGTGNVSYQLGGGVVAGANGSSGTIQNGNSVFTNYKPGTVNGAINNFKGNFRQNNTGTNNNIKAVGYGYVYNVFYIDTVVGASNSVLDGGTIDESANIILNPGAGEIVNPSIIKSYYPQLSNSESNKNLYQKGQLKIVFKTNSTATKPIINVKVSTQELTRIYNIKSVIRNTDGTGTDKEIINCAVDNQTKIAKGHKEFNLDINGVAVSDSAVKSATNCTVFFGSEGVVTENFVADNVFNGKIKVEITTSSISGPKTLPATVEYLGRINASNKECEFKYPGTYDEVIVRDSVKKDFMYLGSYSEGGVIIPSKTYTQAGGYTIKSAVLKVEKRNEDGSPIIDTNHKNYVGLYFSVDNYSGNIDKIVSRDLNLGATTDLPVTILPKTAVYNLATTGAVDFGQNGKDFVYTAYLNGHKIAESTRVNVKYDVMNPFIDTKTFEDVSSDIWYSDVTKLALKFKPLDAGSGVKQVKVNGKVQTANAEGMYSITFVGETSSNRTYTIDIEDNAGNIYSFVRQVKIDTLTPKFTWDHTANKTDLTSNEAITFTYKVDGSPNISGLTKFIIIDGVEYEIDNSNKYVLYSTPKAGSEVKMYAKAGNGKTSAVQTLGRFKIVLETEIISLEDIYLYNGTGYVQALGNANIIKKLYDGTTNWKNSVKISGVTYPELRIKRNGEYDDNFVITGVFAQTDVHTRMPMTFSITHKSNLDKKYKFEGNIYGAIETSNVVVTINSTEIKYGGNLNNVSYSIRVNGITTNQIPAEIKNGLIFGVYGENDVSELIPGSYKIELLTTATQNYKYTYNNTNGNLTITKKQVTPQPSVKDIDTFYTGDEYAVKYFFETEDGKIVDLDMNFKQGNNYLDRAPKDAGSYSVYVYMPAGYEQYYEFVPGSVNTTEGFEFTISPFTPNFKVADMGDSDTLEIEYNYDRINTLIYNEDRNYDNGLIGYTDDSAKLMDGLRERFRSDCVITYTVKGSTLPATSLKECGNYIIKISYDPKVSGADENNFVAASREFELIVKPAKITDISVKEKKAKFTGGYQAPVIEGLPKEFSADDMTLIYVTKEEYTNLSEAEKKDLTKMYLEYNINVVLGEADPGFEQGKVGTYAYNIIVHNGNYYVNNMTNDTPFIINFEIEAPKDKTEVAKFLNVSENKFVYEKGTKYKLKAVPQSNCDKNVIDFDLSEFDGEGEENAGVYEYKAIATIKYAAFDRETKYELVYKMTIDKAIQPAKHYSGLAGKEKVFDGAPFDFSDMLDSEWGAKLNADKSNLLTTTDAGTHKILLVYKKANYEDYEKEVTCVIKPKVVKVDLTQSVVSVTKAEDLSLVYIDVDGNPMPCTIDTSNVQWDKAGSYECRVSIADKNYSLDPEFETIEITVKNNKLALGLGLGLTIPVIVIGAGIAIWFFVFKKKGPKAPKSKKAKA